MHVMLGIIISLESTEGTTEPTAKGTQIPGSGDSDGEVQGSSERWISGVLGAVGATVGLLLLITVMLTVILCIWQCYKKYYARGTYIFYMYMYMYSPFMLKSLTL